MLPGAGELVRVDCRRSRRLRSTSVIGRFAVGTCCSGPAASTAEADAAFGGRPSLRVAPHQRERPAGIVQRDDRPRTHSSTRESHRTSVEWQSFRERSGRPRRSGISRSLSAALICRRTQEDGLRRGRSESLEMPGRVLVRLAEADAELLAYRPVQQPLETCRSGDVEGAVVMFD